MTTDRKLLTELSEKPVFSLLLQYAIPAIVAMVASSLYNIVDGIFIGQGVGAGAIMGLAITMPIMNLSAAFGAMVGVGGSTLLSVKLGEKDYNFAAKILGPSSFPELILSRRRVSRLSSPPTARTVVTPAIKPCIA